MQPDDGNSNDKDMRYDKKNFVDYSGYFARSWVID